MLSTRPTPRSEPRRGVERSASRSPVVVGREPPASNGAPAHRARDASTSPEVEPIDLLDVAGGVGRQAPGADRRSARSCSFVLWRLLRRRRREAPRVRRRRDPLGSNPCSIRTCRSIPTARCSASTRALALRLRRRRPRAQPAAGARVRRDPHPARRPAARAAARARRRARGSLIAQTRPSAVAVERVLFQANARTAISVGQASGLALVAAARAGIPVAQYSPNEVKLAVTGDGRGRQGRGADDGRAAARPRARSRSRPTRPTRSRSRAVTSGARRSPRRSGCRRAGDEHDRLGAGHGARAHDERRGARRGRRRRLPRQRPVARRARRSSPGSNAFLFTHLHVREDAMVLFGFPTPRRARHVRGADRARPVSARSSRSRSCRCTRRTRCAAASPTTTSTRWCSCPASASAPRSGCSST